MNKKVLRIVSVILAISVALPVAACKKSGKRKQITNDTPWYNAEQIELELGVDDSKKVDYLYSQFAGSDDDYLVVFTTGSYYVDYDHIDWNTYNYNDYAINYISVIDRETKETINSINLTSLLGENDYANNATYGGGKITLMASSWDPITYDSLTKEIVVDAKDGKILSTTEIKGDDNGSIERTFTFGEYRVDTEYMWSDSGNTYYNIYVTGADGDKEKVTLKESGVDIYDVPVVISLGDSKVLIPCSTDKNSMYFELDLGTCKAEKVDEKDYEWLEDIDLYGAISGPDGMIYSTNSIGITKIDIKEQTTETFFNYSWCGVNRGVLSYLSVVDCSEDTITLCGSYYSNEIFTANNYSIGEFMLIELTKADTNPHAGKDILELYTPYGYLDEVTSDAILEFNEDNGKYFIEVTDRYSQNEYYDYDGREIESDDDWEKMDLDATAAMSNDLAMDILNGDGPDILLNTSSYGQLNNDAYLADLSKYVSDLDSSKYFMNIIDGARTDGKLYQVPVSFSIQGIQTDASYAGASGVGFTTAEYEEFLKDTLNGDDVIPSGQALYFAKLFTNMSDKFFSNGKADFSGPEFEELAEYVRDNVRETAKTYDELYPDDGYYYGMDEPEIAMYTDCYGFNTYFYNVSELQGGATAILGVPSTDGRGPMFSPNLSVAVSAQAYDIDACGEFIKILMGDNVQRKLGLSGAFIVNSEIFREVGETAVEYYSGEGRNELGGYYYGIDGIDDSQRTIVTMDMVDDLEDVVMSCSSMNASYASINLIIVEEMPAYFSGQKDLDDVIKIMQDKIQTIINERG